MTQRDVTSADRPSTDTDIEALFRREHAGVLRMCQGILGNPDDAEEALQEAFLRVSRKLDTLTGEPGAYLTVVARRVCYEQLRRSGRTVPLDDSAVEQHGSHEGAILDRQLARKTWTGLSATDRRLILGSYYGYSNAEMAARTGLSANSVAVGLHRARKRARVLVESFGSLLPALRTRWLRRRLARTASVEPRNAALPATAAGWIAAAALSLAMVTSGLTPGGGAPRVLARSPVEPSGPLMGAAAPAPRALGRAAAPAAPVAWRPNPSNPGGPPGGGLPLPGGGLLWPGSGAQPETSSAYGIFPSPHYLDDHTIFLSGASATSCTGCATLFVTHDGGVSWTAVTPATGFTGGTILFPPSYPADPTIFAASGTGIVQSDDGGQSFHLVSTGGPGVFAVDPGSAPGRTQVLIGTQTMMRYVEGATPPVAAEPEAVPNEDGLSGLVFAGGGGQILAAGGLPNASGTADGIVTACRNDQCRTVLTVPGDGFIQLAAATDGSDLVLANTANVLWVAHASAPAFTEAPLPVAGHILAALPAPDGHAIVVAVRPPDDTFGQLLFRSTDEGRTWSELPSTAYLEQIGNLLLLDYLPGHQLLATIWKNQATGQQPWVLMCSRDDGRSWKVRCQS